MSEKKDKKQALPLIISCALCLALGLVLGYGIRTQNLTGTAAHIPPIPQAAGTQSPKESVNHMLIKNYIDMQAYYYEKMTALTNTIKAAEDDGEISEDESAALSGLMIELQTLTDRYNDATARIASLLSETGQMYDNAMKSQ